MLIPRSAPASLLLLPSPSELHDFPLARRETFGFVLARARGAVKIAGKDHLRDAAGEVMLMLAERPDGRHEMLPPRSLFKI